MTAVNEHSQWAPTDTLYRYSRNAGRSDVTVDGHRNFKYTFRSRLPEQSVLQLEKGINISREVDAVDGSRRPIVLLRSTPHKAGSETTPWLDEIDLAAGTARYFGDSKPRVTGRRNLASGNRSLVSFSHRYYSHLADERLLAPPIALFKGESAFIKGKGFVHKGFVRFIGIAILRDHSRIQQVDSYGVEFENIVFDLELCPLDDTDGRVDWSWINDRRDETVPAVDANLRAPAAWRHWIETGTLPAHD